MFFVLIEYGNFPLKTTRLTLLLPYFLWFRPFSLWGFFEGFMEDDQAHWAVAFMHSLQVFNFLFSCGNALTDRVKEDMAFIIVPQAAVVFLQRGSDNCFCLSSTLERGYECVGPITHLAWVSGKVGCPVVPGTIEGFIVAPESHEWGGIFQTLGIPAFSSLGLRLSGFWIHYSCKKKPVPPTIFFFF